MSLSNSASTPAKTSRVARDTVRGILKIQTKLAGGRQAASEAPAANSYPCVKDGRLWTLVAL